MDETGSSCKLDMHKVLHSREKVASTGAECNYTTQTGKTMAEESAGGNKEASSFSNDIHIDTYKILSSYPSPPKNLPLSAQSPTLICSYDGGLCKNSNYSRRSDMKASKRIFKGKKDGKSKVARGFDRDNPSIFGLIIKAFKSSLFGALKIIRFIISSRIFLVLCILLLTLALVYTEIGNQKSPTASSTSGNNIEVHVSGEDNKGVGKGEKAIEIGNSVDNTKQNIVDNQKNYSNDTNPEPEKKIPIAKEDHDDDTKLKPEEILPAAKENHDDDTKFKPEEIPPAAKENHNDDKKLKPEKISPVAEENHYAEPANIPSAISTRLDGATCIQKLKESKSFASFHTEYCPTACDFTGRADIGRRETYSVTSASTVCMLGELMSHEQLSRYKKFTNVCAIDVVKCDSSGLPYGLELTNNTYHKIGNVLNYVTCRNIIKHIEFKESPTSIRDSKTNNILVGTVAVQDSILGLEGLHTLIFSSPEYVMVDNSYLLSSVNPLVQRIVLDKAQGIINSFPALLYNAYLMDIIFKDVTFTTDLRKKIARPSKEWVGTLRGLVLDNVDNIDNIEKDIVDADYSDIRFFRLRSTKKNHIIPEEFCKFTIGKKIDCEYEGLISISGGNGTGRCGNCKTVAKLSEVPTASSEAGSSVIINPLCT